MLLITLMRREYSVLLLMDYYWIIMVHQHIEKVAKINQNSRDLCSIFNRDVQHKGLICILFVLRHRIVAFKIMRGFCVCTEFLCTIKTTLRQKPCQGKELESNTTDRWRKIRSQKDLSRKYVHNKHIHVIYYIKICIINLD